MDPLTVTLAGITIVVGIFAVAILWRAATG